VTELSGEGYDIVVSTVTYTIPAEVEALYLKGAGLIGTGSGGDDILLSVAGGANTLIGLGGNDLYYVNNVGDAVTESGGGFPSRTPATW
jgi:serralysin